ncbi:hypothetical protein QE152_g6337 [Popillia japonica]|uniref:Uncharacterized protein n=1 Tax=Popillia japonica TaxID=7064 RepID=A0AAW1MIC6_POPJA
MVECRERHEKSFNEKRKAKMVECRERHEKSFNEKRKEAVGERHEKSFNEKRKEAVGFNVDDELEVQDIQKAGSGKQGNKILGP